MKTMFPREFLLWFVENCWYNEIDNMFGVVGKHDVIYTLDDLYKYWRLEIEPKTKEDGKE